MKQHYQIIALCVVLLLIVINNYYRRTIKINKGVYKWNVVGSFENSHEAANMMYKIHSKINKLLHHLKKKYTTNDKFLHKIVKHLLINYNPEEFYETDPRFTSDTSYTVNKGQKLYMCLRENKKPYKLLNEQIILFAQLHEISHIANYVSWGHDELFWTIFKFILHEAISINIYEPIDYTKHPVKFCGMVINYQPYYDNRLRNIWISQ